jgi:hypothetical protein
LHEDWLSADTSTTALSSFISTWVDEHAGERIRGCISLRSLVTFLHLNSNTLNGASFPS